MLSSHSTRTGSSSGTGEPSTCARLRSLLLFSACSTTDPDRSLDAESTLSSPHLSALRKATWKKVKTLTPKLSTDRLRVRSFPEH